MGGCPALVFAGVGLWAAVAPVFSAVQDVDQRQRCCGVFAALVVAVLGHGIFGNSKGW